MNLEDLLKNKTLMLSCLTFQQISLLNVFIFLVARNDGERILH